MTTNQTINGVPRELLERLLNAAEWQKLDFDRSDSPFKVEIASTVSELRALLDAERCTSCDGSGDLIDLTGEWRGYCVCPAGVALKNKPAEPMANPVLAYADSYRAMQRQGVEAVSIWSVITDLERNIAPLYAEQPAPVADPLAKGFTTLESENGKYKIVTSFQTRDDAWSAYRVLVGARPKPVSVAPTAYDGFDNGID